MTYEELVEKVAQDMVAADSGPIGSALFRMHWEECANGYRDSARVAIASVYEAVKEPTSEMIAAWITPSPKMRPVSVSEQLIAGATRDWTAMLDASPLVPKDT